MIKAKKGLETSKQTRITNFINSGAISGSDDQGINFAYSILTNFINTGMIKGNSKEGVFFNNSRVSIFYNSGTIKNSSKEAVNFTKNSNTIKNFFNKNAIEGTTSGVFLSGNTIETLINTGTIKSATGALHLTKASRITTVFNTGLIQNTSDSAIALYENSSITNLINTGTIESQRSNDRNADIIAISLNKSQGSIQTLINSGTLKSANHGILAESGNKIGTLINKGTIEAKLDGISFYDLSPLNKDASIGQIILEEGSSIDAG
ncbi:hypothetical protein LNU06_07630 [Campylobacter sp. VicNov18]|uniref:hypothetical protein n=1 Tax=Campylobacter bilis TaxID=2691918 RepID=UPI001E2CFB6E|nr:hypothetical protein [Campylobacter bilis]MCC8278534.1 hypothetical protein [Campylobacter bilis]MCC8300034.1 hypothetical protein [Campylobacter bilis]MCC8301444.1 hypothetical protein [Campylobacter bilis]MCC8350600.1 hypothetical protein [Campylobacter bilis]MCC8356220.1 hypothetical protein [Campylobacter bilis]